MENRKQENFIIAMKELRESVINSELVTTRREKYNGASSQFDVAPLFFKTPSGYTLLISKQEETDHIQLVDDREEFNYQLGLEPVLWESRMVDGRFHHTGEPYPADHILVNGEIKYMDIRFAGHPEKLVTGTEEEYEALKNVREEIAGMELDVEKTNSNMGLSEGLKPKSM